MIYEIGKQSQDLNTKADTCSFVLDESGVIIRVAYGNPSEKELAQFRAPNAVRFKLFSHKKCLFLLAKFGDMEWMDMPIDMVNVKGNPIRPVDDGEHLTVTFVMGDAYDGTVKVIRFMTMSTDFSRVLMAEAEKSYRASAYDLIRDLREAQALLSTNDMAARAAASCIGGE